jgi:tripartite-type tricarboxylate transporter receptor subunit TctC
MKVGADSAKALRKIAAAIYSLLAAAIAPSNVAADPVAEFYRGKTIELDVGTGVGGGYDANARLVARHLGRFVPGNPVILVNNLPGGGGIRAANTLYNRSSRDGLVIGTFSNAMITEPLLGAGQAMFEPDKFIWIGSATREDAVCVTARSSGVASWSDLQRKEVVVGTTAPGTTTYMYPIMLKNMFGAKFTPVSGYPDGGQIALAFERGEVQSICQTYSSLKVGHRDWLQGGLATAIITLAFNRIPDLPAVETVTELAANEEQKEVIKVALAPTLAGRPLAFPPGVPPDRAEALRDAFSAMVRDPSFRAEAGALGMDIQPASGREIDALVKHIYALPADVIAQTKTIVSRVLPK